jgi:hypothetical protein
MGMNLKSLVTSVSSVCAGVVLCLAQAAQADAPVLSQPVRIDTNTVQVLLTSDGDDYVIQYSTNLQNWTSVARSGLGIPGSNYSRTISLPNGGPSAFYRAVAKPRLTFGMAALDTITFEYGSTNGPVLDSFDSSDTNYSTGGVYDPAKAMSNFVLGTASTNGSAIVCSNAVKIQGSMHTGPGGAVNFDTNFFSVGDAAWINSNQAGIEPGHSFADMTMTFPDVLPPTGAALTPPGNVNTGGTNYLFVLANNNQLYVSVSQIVASGNNSVLVTGTNVTWWLKKGLVQSGNFRIIIPPTASLKLYVGNTNGSSAGFMLTGAGIVNDGPIANFQYYGLPTNTSFTYSGSHSFNGIVYAPQAALTMGGSSDYFGAFYAKSIAKSGNFSVHYDEALAHLQPGF